MARVVFDHQIFTLQQYGGISRYFCELATGIARTDGFSARVVAPWHINEYLAAKEVPSLGFAIPAKVPRRAGLSRMLSGSMSAPMIRAIRPDIVHQTYYASTRRACSAAQVLTVFDMIHEMFPQHFAADDPTSRLKRHAVNAADHVICISESTRRDLIELFEVPSERVTVTYLGFSDAFALSDGGNAHCEAAAQRPYILYVGHRAGYKNFASALKGYGASATLRKDFDFVAFGGAQFGDDEIDLARSLELRDGALRRETGNDAALAAAYKGAAAFIYPSQYEGFGIPPLEAMSCGCPVVCSDASSIPEVVGSAAAMFDPYSVDSIRAALESVCLSDERRSWLVAAGFDRIKEFSWDRCVRETADVYRKLSGCGGEIQRSVVRP